jgi:hypothetical protein
MDVMIAALGDDYALYRRIIDTYASVGEPHLNWLNMIDNWADQSWLERERAKADAEIAA